MNIVFSNLLINRNKFTLSSCFYKYHVQIHHLMNLYSIKNFYSTHATTSNEQNFNDLWSITIMLSSHSYKIIISHKFLFKNSFGVKKKSSKFFHLSFRKWKLTKKCEWYVASSSDEGSLTRLCKRESSYLEPREQNHLKLNPDKYSCLWVG